MPLNHHEFAISHRPPETWAWLQEHWEDLLSPVPAGTRWAVLSNDGHRLIAFGEDADLLRALAKTSGESEPITVAVPDRSHDYRI